DPMPRQMFRVPGHQRRTDTGCADDVHGIHTDAVDHIAYGQRTECVGESERIESSGREATDHLQAEHYAQAWRERQQDRTEYENCSRKEKHAAHSQHGADKHREWSNKHQGHVVGGGNPTRFIESEAHRATQVWKPDANHATVQSGKAGAEKNAERSNVHILMK